MALTQTLGLKSFAEAEKVSVSRQNYYLKNMDRFVGEFRELNEDVRNYLGHKDGKAFADEITSKAMRRFEELLPEMPDIGGERNLRLENLMAAAWYLAIYEPLKARGRTSEQFGRMMYDLAEFDFTRIPQEQSLITGAKIFSKEKIARLQGWIESTQVRQYPANWVATFVNGDGQNFDFGYDYSECAIVKYTQAQGVPEIAPYLCLYDFPASRAYGTGLTRTKTLANGDDKCDFRFKKGRNVTQSWSTEIEIIRERVRAGKIK